MAVYISLLWTEFSLLWQCADFSSWSWVCIERHLPSVLGVGMVFAVDYNIPPGWGCFYLHVVNVSWGNEHIKTCATFSNSLDECFFGLESYSKKRHKVRQLSQDLQKVASYFTISQCPEGRHGNPLQYSCLENPMDRGAWKAIVHGIAELDMTEVT